MTGHPFDDLLAVYSLDAVEPHEREAIEDHLRDCPRCSAEVAGFREVASLLAPGQPAPLDVWDRIQDALEEPAPAIDVDLGTHRLRLGGPPVAPAGVTRLDERRTDTGARPAGAGAGTVRRPGSIRPAVRWLAAAAAAVVVALVAGLLVGTTALRDDPATLVAQPGAVVDLHEAARNAFTDPTNRRVTLRSFDGTLTAEAVVLADGAGYLIGSQLPALPDDRTYQLWGMRDSVPVSLGVLGARPMVIAFHAADDVAALLITDEPAGGVPTTDNAPLLAGDVA